MKVFVYGTLRSGGRLDLAATLDGAEVTYIHHGQHTIQGRMYDWDGFPAVTLTESGTVIGEVIEITDTPDAADFELKRLDRIEGTPRLYQRSAIDVGEHTGVWIYSMTPERASMDWTAPVVGDGDWLKHYNAKPLVQFSERFGWAL